MYSCGHFIENGLHCPYCGAEPPLDCPSLDCKNPEIGDEFDFEDYDLNNNSTP